MTLPKSLDPVVLLGKGLPGDMTVGECRAFVMTLDEFKQLAKASKRANGDTAKIAIIYTVDGKVVDDSMTLREWRAKNGKISFDDGSGGMLVS